MPTALSKGAEDVPREKISPIDPLTKQQVKNIINKVMAALEAFFERHPDIEGEHGLLHARIVYNHALEAIKQSRDPLSHTQQVIILVAALLHDVDDHKFYKTENLANARGVMAEAETPFVEEIVTCINLVGYTHNQNSASEMGEWALYPRHADRLEAMGWPGVRRALHYALYKNHELYDDRTPRVINNDQLEQALVVRAEEKKRPDYVIGTTFMDYFFDKLVHIGLNTGNEYFDTLSRARMSIIYDVVFEYGRTGVIDVAQLKEKIERNK